MGNVTKALEARTSQFGSTYPSFVSFECEETSTTTLSETELVCLTLYSDGYDFQYFSERFSYSENTARIILDNARRKLNASNLSQATKIAIGMGLITP